MTPFVRTNQSAHLLMKISQIVVVLLLIFMPMLALANPTFPNSESKKTTPIAGKQSYHAEPVSYQMYNTSAYKVSTTYNPAQTMYEPFSDETPSNSGSRNNGQSSISGRRNLGENNSGNPGANETQSPIGEPWIMLAFAAMTAGVITLRKKQTA